MPMRTPALSFFSAAAIALLATLMFVSGVGCGDDPDSSGAGEVTIDELRPAAGYPDVEVRLAFSIAPAEGRSDDGFSWRVNFGDGATLSGVGVEGSASHRYTSVGEYTIEVEALFEGSRADRETVIYRVYDPINVGVEAVSARPTNVRTGEVATISFDVINRTASPVLTDVPVRAYLSTTAQISRAELASLTVLGETLVEATTDDGEVLGGGATRNVGFSATVPDVASGSYFVAVVLAPDGELADTDLDDNIAVSLTPLRVENFDAGLADISLSDLVVSPDRAFPTLNRLTRGFVLENRGGEDVFNVVHRTYLQVGSPVRDASAILLHESAPIGIPAQASRVIGPEAFVLAEEIIPEPESELEVYLFVEAFSEDGDVQESTLDNNELALETPIIVSDQLVDGPDIAVRNFAVTPASTYLGGNLEVSATIANEGTLDVGSFFCGVYLGLEARPNVDNDSRITNINVAALASGATREVERTVNVPMLVRPGVYFPYVVCDPLGAIEEPFRSNNTALQLDAVNITDEADIDLFVASLTVPSSATQGDLITVRAEICVDGSNASGATAGALFRSAGTSVNFGADPVETFEIPNINPGECEELTFEVEAQCADFIAQQSFGLAVDTGGLLPEANVTNNRRTGTNPLAVEGPFCTCTEDANSPNHQVFDAVNTSAGTLDAAVCVPNTCDFYETQVSAGQTLIVTTRFDSDRGALQTTLFAPNRSEQLARTATADEQQVAVFLAPASRVYPYSVCGRSAGDQNYYELDVQVLDLASDVDVLPRALELPPQTTWSAGATIDLSAEIVNIGAVATGGFEARVVLTSSRELGGEGDITLGNFPIASIESGSSRQLTLPVELSAGLADGTYHLALTLDPAGSLNESRVGNNTAFSTSFEVFTRCFDPFSPNTSFDEAASLTEGSFSNLLACAGQSDYYEICVADGQQFDATINFLNSQGDLDLRLFAADRSVIDTSARSGVDEEQVGVDYVNGAQCYYLRVSLVPIDPDASTTYTLDLDVREVDPALRCDGDFEPNNDLDNATSLRAALDAPAALDRCPVGDVDVYHVELAAGQPVTLRANLEPAAQPGILRMQIYRPNRTPDDLDESAPGLPRAELINYVPPVSGRYFVEISVGGSERRVTYTLEAEDLPGIDLSATNLTIGPGSYQEGDVVRYGFDLTNAGGDTAAAPTYEVFLGTSAIRDQGQDIFLGEFALSDVAPGQTLDVTGQVALPAGYTPGTGYLHVVVDPLDEFGDVNRANNVASRTIELVEAQGGTP
ncbi:hypothetical protein EA187_04660 [Lujinxingia sediminis]|uniref:PKD domain-containing protein n=1 Tax=Lujinxingia sediminis TaxID=2480984 RepID=A0ABY0CYS1_9DELT|nr:CARDB domain-containing protein [Lujinxingia sediminis]RVU48726.1 hypothetical protein EA187_04660 [Lujinxingia sediminis]